MWSRLFLPLDKYMGGRAGLNQLVFSNALDSLATPHNTTYYIPWAAGVRGSVTTVNATQYKAKGIDYTKFSTWDDVVNAAKELTVFKNGKMTRSGLSPINGARVMIQSWIWQMGGNFYNPEVMGPGSSPRRRAWRPSSVSTICSG